MMYYDRILALIALIAVAIVVVYANAEDEIICEGRGWSITTTADELSKPLVTGTLPDGREVAMSRDSILKCR